MNGHFGDFKFLVLATALLAGACGDLTGDDGEDAGVGEIGDGGAQDVGSPCPDISIEYWTSSGRRVCCPLDTILCDEIEDWYPGGCWKSETDCSTIIWCADRWQACIPNYRSSCEQNQMACLAPCPEGMEEYKTTSGRRICCTEDTQLFCDETDAGYPGGCFGLGIDCETLSYCGEDWRACREGASPVCSEDDIFSCVI